jgi:hypothetical protein
VTARAVVRCYRCPDGRDLTPGDRCPFCGSIAGEFAGNEIAAEIAASLMRYANARPNRTPAWRHRGPAKTVWTKRCEECNSTFEANHRDARFCGSKCQKRRRRAELVCEKNPGGTRGIGVVLNGGPTPANTGPVDPYSRTAKAVIR